MRLRNIKRAKSVIEESNLILKTMDDCKKFTKINSRNFIEIGMGKGDFIINQALLKIKNNYIGIEKYESVALRAIEKIEKKEEINNIKFMCIDAIYLKDYLLENSIDGIYLNFSDPWSKNKHSKRRLTDNKYLSIYRYILKSNGFIEQKTDNKLLFDYSINNYQKNGFKIDYLSYDLYADEELLKDNIQTEYEKKFHNMGKKIFKVKVINESYMPT